MQTAAKPSPKQANKEIEFGGRFDLSLKIGVRPHRFVLPKIRSDLQQTAEFYLEPVKDLPHFLPLCPYVARRGDKNANRFHLAGVIRDEDFYPKHGPQAILESQVFPTRYYAVIVRKDPHDAPISP